jgi:hypothetical protein
MHSVHGWKEVQGGRKEDTNIFIQKLQEIRKFVISHHDQYPKILFKN